MILADKIIILRKKNGWSQEELADKLGVSRQSISKYESAQSMPDLSKILKMSELFSVSTDYLMKDNLEIEEYIQTDTDVDQDMNVHKVSMEMAQDYLKKKIDSSIKIAAGVALCILSPVTLIALAGASEVESFHISENAATGIGLCVLILFVAAAVAIFIHSGFQLKKYEFLENELIETEYGVSGMVKEKREAFQETYARYNCIGILFCICSVLPLFLSIALTKNEFTIICMVCLLLAMVSIGVFMLVYGGVQMSAMNQILEEGDYTKKNKENNKKKAPFMGAYWLIATAIYLAYSFLTNNWQISWVVWPIAGVLFPVYNLIVSKLL